MFPIHLSSLHYSMQFSQAPNRWKDHRWVCKLEYLPRKLRAGTQTGGLEDETVEKGDFLQGSNVFFFFLGGEHVLVEAH